MTSELRSKANAVLILSCISLCCQSQGFANRASASPQEPSAQTASAQTAKPPAPAQSLALAAPIQQASAASSGEHEITEEEIKQLLMGRTLYLRGGYMDNSLSFDKYGHLVGHSPTGSYTLNQVQINKVHLSKHRVELQGDRFGLHFLGASVEEDSTKAVDRVRITPKKKVVKITIEREAVEKPRKKKKSQDEQKTQPAPSSDNSSDIATARGPQPAADAQTSSATGDTSSASEGTQHPTSTESPEHARRVLHEALDRIFSPGIDDRMIAAMPDFWKLYYQAAAAKTNYRPTDPAVFSQSSVERKAMILSNVEPSSNEFAQANGVAGLALYRAVIGPDGKAQQVVVDRPIGFGLDENAVDTIRKATFEPAVKEGKPVTVWLDLVVQFRIYSKRTMGTGASTDSQQAADKAQPLPGPYSAQHPPETSK